VSGVDGSRTPLRCTHCGREVAETVHTRSSYRVDYYALHTGDVEPVVIRVDQSAPPVTILRLLRAENLLTCVDCYRRPKVQAERELLFRPERSVVGEEQLAQDDAKT
jgi:hypothetical protein